MIDKETGIWSLKEAKTRHRCDFLLAASIGTFYNPPKRAVDLGCGNGRYCSIFSSYGWPSVCGYEGTLDVDKLGVYENICYSDLSKPVGKILNSLKYDFVLSLEVGEHIPKQYEQIFINNVCEFVKKDLVLSWAIPGQKGMGHVNERSNEYIIQQFEERGLIFWKKMSDGLRKRSSLKWFKNTIMVFRRE